MPARQAEHGTVPRARAQGQAGHRVGGVGQALTLGEVGTEALPAPGTVRGSGRHTVRCRCHFQANGPENSACPCLPLPPPLRAHGREAVRSASDLARPQGECSLTSECPLRSGVPRDPERGSPEGEPACAVAELRKLPLERPIGRGILEWQLWPPFLCLRGSGGRGVAEAVEGDRAPQNLLGEQWHGRADAPGPRPLQLCWLARDGGRAGPQLVHTAASRATDPSTRLHASCTDCRVETGKGS